MSDTELFDHRPRAKRKLNRLPENPEAANGEKAARGRFPSWLHRKLPKGSGLTQTAEVMKGQRLHTVCEEAKCPNLLECWSKKTATFLALGKDCTRACGFCDVDFAKHPAPLDPAEPTRVAESVKALGLNHVVITQVARDDLADGGSAQIAAIIQTTRQLNPQVTVEILTSDFYGNEEAWETVLNAKPDIFNYNLETVRELTPRVRHRATYDRTLKFLRYAKEKDPEMFVKSGLMLGLGETQEQVHESIRDLKSVGVDIITMGQYLQPSRLKLPVKEFVTPQAFDAYVDYGRSIGILHMYCGPFVRSSYNADQVHNIIRKKINR